MAKEYTQREAVDYKETFFFGTILNQFAFLCLLSHIMTKYDKWIARHFSKRQSWEEYLHESTCNTSGSCFEILIIQQLMTLTLFSYVLYNPTMLYLLVSKTFKSKSCSHNQHVSFQHIFSSLTCILENFEKLTQHRIALS